MRFTLFLDKSSLTLSNLVLGPGVKILRSCTFYLKNGEGLLMLFVETVKVEDHWILPTGLGVKIKAAGQLVNTDVSFIPAIVMFTAVS